VSRISILPWFRAEGAVVNWRAIDREQVKGQTLPRQVEEARAQALAGRDVELHLRWATAQTVGVPFGPFLVWMRPTRDQVEPVRSPDRSQPVTVVPLPEEAGVVEIECGALDPAQPVSAFGRRGRPSGGSQVPGALLSSVVAADAANVPSGRTVLRLRGAGMTSVVVLNATRPEVRIDPLTRIINDPAWELVERVGLPVDETWRRLGYALDEQGLVSAPRPPVDAAIDRVTRGGPPIGWYPRTEDGALAPPWTAPDSRGLVKEVRGDLLPEISRLFDSRMTSGSQHTVSDKRTVDPPSQGGRSSNAATSATLSPLGLLLLAGTSEPALALATGFGTSYTVEPSTVDGLSYGETDFMVTAQLTGLPFIGDAELASFVPWPADHSRLPVPTQARSERDGLVEPEARDRPWRESIEVTWNRVDTSALLARPTGTGFARYDAGASAAESLLPPRASGGWRTLLPMPDGPPGEPGHDRVAVVDAGLPIPLGSGTRTISHAVAVHDVFGVWSRWRDTVHAGAEPARPLPRVISATLTSTYAGTDTCPSVVELEVALDWTVRTPTAVDLSLGFYAMPTPRTPPPAGLGPMGATPSGFRLNVTIPFTGDVPVESPGVAVEALDPSGGHIVRPGPAQGEEGRRYRVRLDVPTLDFSGTQRWGVRVWVRSHLVVLPGPGSWGPDDAVTASAGTPVPEPPLPQTPPPGVPLASTPDAEGRAHVLVEWSLRAGASPDRVVVWETSETALRRRAGVGAVDETQSPGQRLQALWAAYDGITSPGDRRAAFRRLLELPGTARETDVALPKGSTDIHLYVVTTTTTTGVESPWPSGGAQATLQAAIAPRVVQPAVPRVESTIGSASNVSLSMQAMSLVDVAEFRLYRTLSPTAARRHTSMGPPFATVAAVPPPATQEPDPRTGERAWTADWSGTFDPSWQPWHVRVVAVPVATMPVDGIRGQQSPSSEAIRLTVRPSGPPDLTPLTADSWGSADTGVVVRTSTTAPVDETSLGPHRVSAAIMDEAGNVLASLPPVEISTVPVDTASPPTGASPGPVLTRTERTGGLTPIRLWFERDDPDTAVQVSVTLADPLGRTDTETVVVPPRRRDRIFVEIVDTFRITGRGIRLRVRSNAPVSPRSPGIMRVKAARRLLGRRPRILETFALHKIPMRRGATTDPGQMVQVVRSTPAQPHEYAVSLRVSAPVSISVQVVMDDGASASDRVTITR
jgi:hypothetical protein